MMPEAPGQGSTWEKEVPVMPVCTLPFPSHEGQKVGGQAPPGPIASAAYEKYVNFCDGCSIT